MILCPAFLAGCPFLMLDDAHLNSVVGYQSSPLIVPKVREASIHAYPLNSNKNNSDKPFVICISTWWEGDRSLTKPKTISFSPPKVKLSLGNKTVMPTGFAVGKCPYPELGNLRQALWFEITDPNSSATAIEVTNGFQDVAFFFDVITPTPNEKFTLELSSIKLDSSEFLIANNIGFEAYYGAIPNR